MKSLLADHGGDRQALLLEQACTANMDASLAAELHLGAERGSTEQANVTTLSLLTVRDKLPAVIDLLAENPGVHAIVGYRTVRRDNLVRRVSSRVGNAVRNRLSGDDIRDTGCSLKVFRAAPLKNMPLFEGMHRFLPTLLRFHGYQVMEHPVSHRPRVAGESKYGVLNRAWVAFKDLLAIRWMRGRIRRPDVILLSEESPLR